MGLLYNNGKSNNWSYDVGVENNNAELEKLQKIAKKSNLKTPEDKPKISLLDKLFGFLNAGETAPAVYEYLKSSDPKKALEAQAKASVGGVAMQGQADKKTYENVLTEQLGMKKGIGSKVAGVAGDILLDPTTYVGGIVGKAVTKGVGKIAPKVIKAASKLPVAGPLVEGGVKATDELLSLFSKTKGLTKLGLTKDVAEGYLTKKNTLLKAGRYEEAKLYDEVLNAAEGLSKTKVSGKDVGQAIESGAELTDKADEVKKFIQGKSKSLLEAERSAGFDVAERQDYMAHVMTDEARNFTKKYGYDIPALQKGLGFSKNRTLEGSAEVINKEFRSWLKETGQKEFDLFEEDALKALSGRGLGSIRARTAKTLRDEIADTFGIMDSAMKEKTGKFLGDKVNIINNVKYVPMPGLKMGGEEGLKTLTSKGSAWVPEAIAKDMDEINKVFINDSTTSNLLKIYDKALGAFKGSVTAVFPSFHMNNLKGGIFNNTLAGVWDPTVYKDALKLMGAGTDDVFKFKNFKGTGKELVEELSKRGAINAGGYMDIAAEVGKVGKLGAQGGPVRRLTQGIMGKIETFNRGSLALDTLKKGGTLDEAVKKIFKYQFDYMPEAFTPFERNVMRRLIPFYTWSKNNIPLMLESAIKQPGKVGAVGKIGRDISNITPEERANMPEYMKEGFPVKAGKELFYGANLPIEDINKLTPKGVASLVSPFIKAPIEQFTGKNFYFDQPIEDFKKAPSWFKAMPKVVKDAFGYTERKGAGGKTVSELDPYKYHLLTSALGRYVFTADKLANPDTSLKIKTLYGLLGVKGTDFDPKQLEYYHTKEDIEKLKKFLIQKGAVKEFSTTYEPKK